MIFIASSVFYRVCTVHPNIVQIQYVHVIFAAGACIVGGASYSVRACASHMRCAGCGELIKVHGT